MKIKREFKLFREYKLRLQGAEWQSACERLGLVPGLVSPWCIFGSLRANGKRNCPLTELFIKTDPATEGEKIASIASSFPHASLTPPVPPNACAGPEADTDLDRPFSMGEMVAVIKQDCPRSARGHGRITWQEYRNLGEEAQDALLTAINDFWASGSVPNGLKRILNKAFAEAISSPNESLGAETG